MIEQLWTELQKHFAANQFLSGGFFLMLLGVLGAALRSYPQRIYHWFLRRLFVDLEIPMADEAYWWVFDWLAEQPYGKDRSREGSPNLATPASVWMGTDGVVDIPTPFVDDFETPLPIDGEQEHIKQIVEMEPKVLEAPVGPTPKFNPSTKQWETE